jgi:hypothetical protein
VRAAARIRTEHTITSKKKPTADAAAFFADAAEREQTYAEAKALADQHEHERAAALDHLADVEARPGAHTTSDLTEARAAVDLAVLCCKQSAAASAAAERRLVNTSTDLADALTPFVEEVLGLTGTAQPYRPTEPLPAPTVMLVQRTASKLDARSGSLSGEVEVWLYRERFHRQLDAAAFQSHAERHGGPRLSAHPLTATEQDGVYVEVVRLVVNSAFPALPVVAPGNDEDGLRNLAADIVQGVSSRLDHVALDTSRSIVSDRVSGGTRAVTVEVAVLGSPTRKGTTALPSGETVRYGASLDAIRGEVERVALGLDGKAVDGLGRVQSVEVKGASVVEGAGSARAAGQMVVIGESGNRVRVDGVEIRLVFEIASRLP